MKRQKELQGGKKKKKVSAPKPKEVKEEEPPLEFPPPPLVFTDDMEVINTWPDAWYKAVPLMKKRAVLPGVWKGEREVVAEPPPINEMAKVWHDYPGHAQGTQGWHNQRFDYIISGSRVGTIIGQNPYQNAQMLFDQLRGAMPNDPVNHHMIRGTKFEPVAMDYLSTVKGWCLLDMPLIHHKDRKRYPILVASLDRMFAGQADGGGQKIKRIVECKCPFCIKESNLQLYDAQMQLQIECVTSHMEDEDERNECECYLFQYRDSSWAQSGVHEYRMDRVARDPSWLTRHWPTLREFDQKVRKDRIRNGITLEVYNALGAASLKVFEDTKKELTEAGAMDAKMVEEVAKQAMVRKHQEEYNAHKFSRIEF